MRRRRSPSLEAFLAPVNISNAAILETLRAISTELVSSFSGDSETTPFYQVKNSRSLIRKIQVISILLDAFPDVGFSKTSTSVFLCFKELYLLLYRSKILIDYVKGSSKLWLLLQNHSISGHFHDLNQEISTLFDVFPLSEINLPQEVKEQVELLGKQSRKSKLFIDKHDDLLRLKLYYFLNEFENGIIHDKNVLRSFFVEKLGIRNVKSCRFEIEFLEEQIVNHDGDIEPTASILNGFVALMRYCRFLLFRFEDEVDLEKLNHNKTKKKGLVAQEIGDTFLTIPKDFCCPVSLDLMKDPVIISTGQTYERSSISRWMQEGHCTCPKTGQMLVHTKLVPNRALRNLITQWCTANEIPYDPPGNSDYFSDNSNNINNSGSPSNASIVATKATSLLLVGQLANGSPSAKTVAAMEIRFLAKTGKHNRACLAEAGAIPLLKGLLSSFDAYAQENSVTALLNLSIYDKNKSVIMEVDGCLAATVEVLRYGLSTEARENAAATLFSLSAVHEFKKRIAQEEYAIEALSGLLRDGSPRGQKDAVTALFNLSTHVDNCERLIESGAIKSLVEALGCENVSEEAAGALALIVRQPCGAEAVGSEEAAVAGLIGMMRCGGPRGKENAVAALLELCRSGGAAAMERVVRAPALAGLLQGLLFTGTKRARRKAASLARVFQRSSESASLHFGGLGVGYALAGNSGVARESFGGDVAMQVSISVPVL
ncbi:U-box domain-containing protein 17 [Phtheirospermum japonicum]|uniref:RING-type E3 ubiquitin transferase n=1 Tax=Phtheirospermum japonicum TaxID=374723 RepID=A0A830CBG4_9LAMI|nr:U-box domain-containing protein 17 [Phtheirospermum japonicum]